ncbi:MAG TPA: hypothetical protein VK053_07810 [Jiangellaceae bacterium]|nr:hypothetical protein [Jiangellaceae bacterium]
MNGRELYRRTRTGGIKLVRRVPGVRRAARAIAGGPKVKIKRIRIPVKPPPPPQPPPEDPYAPLHDITGAPAGLVMKAGRYVPPGRGQTWPVVVIVAQQISEEQTRTLCERIERAQMLGAKFRPLIVSSTPHFPVVRGFDFPVDHLMSEQHYRGLNPHHDYQTYVAERVRSITAAYRARAVFPIHADRHLPTEADLRLLGAFG